MPTYFKNLKDTDFFNFQTTLVAEATTNAVAWIIPPAIITTLTNYSTGYVPKYNAIVNKQTRTPQQVQDHQQARDDYEDYIEDFAKYYIINNPAITDSTVEMLGFKRRPEQGSARPVIMDGVYGKLESSGGSKVIIMCRISSDSNRPSVHEDADGVEIKYAIGDAPPNVDACPNKEISTKAKFGVQLTAADAGKKIHAYLRWRNNVDPDKSGPWSDKLETIIK